MELSSVWAGAISGITSGVYTAVVWIVWLLIIGIGGFLLMRMLQFRVAKCVYYDVASGKVRRTRFMWSDKHKNTWLAMCDNLGFSKILHHPCPENLMNPGRFCYARRTVTGLFEFIPNPYDSKAGSVVYVPPDLRAFQSFSHIAVNREFKDAAEKRQMQVMFFAMLIAGVLIVGGSLAFAYFFGSPTVEAMNSNTGALIELGKRLGGGATGTPIG